MTYGGNIVDGTGSPQADFEIRKALTSSGVDTGAALRYQDLDPTISVMTNTMKDIAAYQRLPRDKAYSTLHEFRVLKDYGYMQDDAAYNEEVDTPKDDSAAYEARSIQLKFMGKRGSVSDALRLTKTIVNPETQETMTQQAALIRTLERGILNGNSALNGLRFDGLSTQILARSPKPLIVDAHDSPLTYDMIDGSLTTLREPPFHAYPTEMWASPGTIADYNRLIMNTVGRGNVEAPVGQRGYNYNFRQFESAVGNIEFVPVPFIGRGSAKTIAQGPQAGLAPFMPTVTAPTAADASGPGISNFRPLSDEGAYFYQLQAVNKYGASMVVDIGSGPVTVAKNQVVSFDITPAQGGVPDFFIIYRSRVNGSKANTMEIARVKNTSPAGMLQATTFVDANSFMPGTTFAYILQNSVDVIAWTELLKMAKFRLARTRTSLDFMVNTIAALNLKVETKVLLIKNVGPSIKPAT